MSTFSQRIAKTYEHAKRVKHLGQEQIAEQIRSMPGGETCTQAAISALKTRTTGKGSTFTAHIAAVCGVDALWLATGIGEMLPSDHPVYQVAEKKSVYGNVVDRELIGFCLNALNDALAQTGLSMTEVEKIAEIMSLYAMFIDEAADQRPTENNVVKMIQYKHRSS